MGLLKENKWRLTRTESIDRNSRIPVSKPVSSLRDDPDNLTAAQIVKSLHLLLGWVPNSINDESLILDQGGRGS
jgi:hypothetical protein